MRRISIVLIPIVLSIVVSVSTIVVLDSVFSTNAEIIEPNPTPVPTPLSAYTLHKLSQTKYDSSDIMIGDIFEKREDSSTYIFTHSFAPNPQVATAKKTVTGTISIPSENNKYPLVLLIRGYVDKEIYSPGIGTKNAGIYFADNGFITIAPDFLGYADSDIESFDIFEARFQTYTTVLSILSSLDSLDNWDGKNIFIWAHSNGGQIALTTLATTGKDIPTTLWAPVTKGFPYSIMYYTDELIDEGKYIRRELSQFEQLYDVNEFSFTKYLEQIQAPLYIHHGTADDAVPFEWSQEFSNSLDKLEIENTLFIHSGADHNMRPAWDEAIRKDLDFFIDNIE